MYVRVKLMDTGQAVTIIVSRTTLIKDLKTLVEKEFFVVPECQRMFFRGKQLEEEYRLFDYGININDVIQLMVKKQEKPKSPSSKIALPKVPTLAENIDNVSHCLYFKLGDYVDVKDSSYESWFTGKLLKIQKNISHTLDNPNTSSNSKETNGLVYVVEFTGCPNEQPIAVEFNEIRPRSSEIVPLEQLKPGDTVLMNYNAEYPSERGYWYDVLIKKVKSTKKGDEVTGDVYIGKEQAVLKNCRMLFLDDIFKIKPNTLITERTPEDDKIIQTEPVTLRVGPLMCITCRDNKEKKCKECGCHICGLKDNEDTQILCDECNSSYHIACLTPPLKEIPIDDWYCPTCKNDENEIVKAGEKLKASKKKPPINMSTSKRDWGKGMACVGRTKKCNIVPSNHFGSIPGVEVGTTWLFRVQVSEAGIHRPPVGGIHGRDNQGAFSLVLSGGYEDDVDNGDEFMYTGSGGRDLSGNKRTAAQSCNQELTRNNKALALNCNAKFNDIKGATAVDWKKGKPVRVVRNYKLQKHSKYAPEKGNRYDGLYKVVKYYPQTGASGFIVWRYVLRRDDPIPAPWTKQGKIRMAQLGLELIYPENYIEPATPETSTKRKKSDSKDNESTEKKVKLLYELDQDVKKLIKADVVNKKYWDDCKESLDNGRKMFLDRVEETFLCICCQDIVFDPITTKCSHNICKGCLKRSFGADVYQCPACRAELGERYSMQINTNLAQILLNLFPGYTTDRQ
ncbi:Zinc finger, PHD-type,Zinc finger, RING-type,Zinc finger, FYVE/PHD-type,Ubiquitin-related [Cinara cedri]|uniref:RING-type E3 ubiquitin transferase n=1 Tax=Cinara cedri TaxID=506608 RepID=A0A5E4NFZ3_9HEMI|nr:Zinc finger, PHD-type,Zinc finger, RING-type,Zinc finger, FYVE/PHD-type,Ubiquitin-related [Cinara cedri]